jgi:hypothetical protein
MGNAKRRDDDNAGVQKPVFSVRQSRHKKNITLTLTGKSAGRIVYKDDMNDIVDDETKAMILQRASEKDKIKVVNFDDF